MYQIYVHLFCLIAFWMFSRIAITYKKRVCRQEHKRMNTWVPVQIFGTITSTSRTTDTVTGTITSICSNSVPLFCKKIKIKKIHANAK